MVVQCFYYVLVVSVVELGSHHVLFFVQLPLIMLDLYLGSVVIDYVDYVDVLMGYCFEFYVVKIEGFVAKYDDHMRIGLSEFGCYCVIGIDVQCFQRVGIYLGVHIIGFYYVGGGSDKVVIIFYNYVFWMDELVDCFIYM